MLAVFSMPLFGKGADGNELTDAIFPRTDPKTIGLIYQMLEAIDHLFTKNEIPYWIDGGTALGAVRHQGCIPWDDDADLGFHVRDQDRILALKNDFADLGFHLEQTTIIRLHASKDQQVPFIDLAGYRLYSNRVYRFDLKWARKFYKKFYWLSREIEPLVRVKFGPLTLNAPNDMERYLFTGYGSDCLTHATYQSPHGNTAQKKKIREKVRVVDFSPAAFKN